ncbi:hypothetical protein CI109_100879 [Kwoniella shandongensis]|uniref:Uncharacterized protein n=1 Tax=Kwoniella shandongensis TaxID=1734106 RepID=A0A5M6BX30_9TREE|nr:uncharacterized protein CI109_006132 [Kwoniella shandongensis]KAA5525559.1 hypothetical protein CI109_006132 [Kwoniella shandongensis]
MSKTDRQPLLPTHINHSSSSRLSRPKISFPSSSTTSLGDETATLVANSEAGSSPDSRFGKGRSQSQNQGSPLVAMHDGGRREGIPKLTRECLWSEIKCYGSYMLPPLLVFGVLVIGASLFAVGWKMGWFK